MSEKVLSNDRRTYKGIIIDLNHAEQINEEIAKVEAKCKSRLLAEVYGDGYKRVAQAVKMIEEHFYYLPKTAFEGCEWRYDYNNQDFAKAYKYIPESTQAVITYTGGKWRLLKVSREITMPKSYSFVAINLTGEFKSAIIEKSKKF